MLIAATACLMVIAHIAERLPQQLDTAIVETRGALLKEVSVTRAELLGHLTALESRTDSRLAAIEADVTSQLARTVDTANGQLTATLARVDAALEEVSGLHSEIAPVLVHLGSVAKQVDEASPLFLDCDHNVDCAFNRFQGTSKAVERAAQNIGAMTSEVRGALPPALATWQHIGGNVDLTAANVARITKVRWYDNLLKGAGVGLGSAAIVLRH